MFAISADEWYHPAPLRHAQKVSASRKMDDSRTVLVVDDDPEINALVGEYVSLAGFSPRAAHDGAEAEAAVREQAPALIVLDLMLPDTDGASLCQRLRARLEAAAVPVLILSAMEHGSRQRIAEEIGAAAEFCKPFDPDALISAIQMLAR